MDVLNKYRLINKTKHLCKLYMSLLFLTNNDHEDVLMLDKIIINDIKNGIFDSFKKLEEEVIKIKTKYGAYAEEENYIKLYEDAYQGLHRYFLISKFILLDLFCKYENVFEDKTIYNKIPIHAKIGLDKDRTPKDINVSIFQIEQFIFQDIAYFLNIINDLIGNKNIDPLKNDKRIRSLSRSIILLSFNLLESYLNGLACDHLIEKGSSLSDKEKTLLSEYNQDNQREQYTSLSNKLSKYLTIISGSSSFVQHHQGQIKYIVDKAKKYRDAIVHAKPITYYESADYSKEYCLYETTSELANEILTNIINIIKAFDKCVNDQSKLWWLVEPDQNGFYPF